MIDDWIVVLVTSSQLVESILHRIWSDIVTGALRPGTAVTEEEFCRRTGASRTPVREAIRRLEAVGLVVRNAGRQLRIADLSLDEMEQLSSVREALEGLLARQAAQRVGEAKTDATELRRLLKQMRAMESVDEIEALLELGDRFHRRIWQMSGNVRCMQILEGVILGFERYRHLIHHDAVRHVRQMSMVSDHSTIIEKIAAGEQEAAERVMREHIARAREVYRLILRRLIASTSDGRSPQPTADRSG